MIAVLTPFPNTEGFTVLISKQHQPSDILQLDKNTITLFMDAAQVVSKLLREKLKVARVGLVFEGYAVDHAHIKLIPMHGTKEVWKPVISAEDDRKFYVTYPGFISSHDGPKATDQDLDNTLRKIVG